MLKFTFYVIIFITLGRVLKDEIHRLWFYSSFSLKMDKNI